jgi:hypothetical protein
MFSCSLQLPAISMPGMALLDAAEYESTMERLNEGHSASQRGQNCPRKQGTLALIRHTIDGIPDGDF